MRRTGRTTRQVDQYIQELFKNGSAIVRDHFETIDTDQSIRRGLNRIIIDRMISRLVNEHRIKKEDIKYNYAEGYISFRTYSTRS